MCVANNDSTRKTRNTEQVRLLIAAGADVNATNANKDTALMYAAKFPEVAKLLLNAGADPSMKNKQNNTVFSFSSFEVDDLIKKL